MIYKPYPVRVLCADPPWPFGPRNSSPSRRVEKNYTTMTQEEIEAFPLPPLADNALLFLWRVSSQVEEAYRVVRAWGFVPKTEIVWNKLTATGKPWFGMGRITRAAHETCVVGKRGAPKILAKNVRSTFSAAAGAHSEKPEIFYTGIVEALSDGPYAELFARRPRPGWDCYGDQLPSAGAPCDPDGMVAGEREYESDYTPDLGDK